MKTTLFLSTAISIALVFTLNSCASKAQQAATPSQEELREKKEDMMKKLDEGTAAHQEK